MYLRPKACKFSAATLCPHLNGQTKGWGEEIKTTTSTVFSSHCAILAIVELSLHSKVDGRLKVKTSMVLWHYEYP